MLNTPSVPVESQQVETGGPHPQIGEKIDEKTDEGLQPEAAVRSSPDITQLGDKEGWVHVLNCRRLSPCTCTQMYIHLHTCSCLPHVMDTSFSCLLNRSPSTPLPRSDSKPYVAVLDRSSQLMEDTFSEEPRVVIDATPPVGKRGRRVKKRKSSEEEEGERKKGKYQLRNRKKHKRILGVSQHFCTFIHMYMYVCIIMLTVGRRKLSATP